MHGILIPASGGKTLALRKERHYLGRVAGTDRAVPLGEDNAFCALQLSDGWWIIEDLNCPSALKINGRAVKRDRVSPGDEVEIGRRRYRIEYEAPKAGVSGRRTALSARRAAAAKQSILRQAASCVLGRLVPVGGGEVRQLNQSPVTIGRKAPCDIVIPARTVSGRHCELSLRNGYWHAKDLGSHNGIRIDGKPCEEGWVLPQHRISIAEQRFILEYEGRGPAPVPDIAPEVVGKPLMDRLGLSADDFQETDDAPAKKRKYRPF